MGEPAASNAAPSADKPAAANTPRAGRPPEHHPLDQRRERHADDEASVRVHGRYVANHAEVRLEGALAGLGIACLPSFIATPALADGRLVRVLADWEFIAPHRGRALLMYPPSRFVLPKCRVLIDHLADALSASG
jgi:DNA-binding transcriptional LysR family regulator